MSSSTVSQQCLNPLEVIAKLQEHNQQNMNQDLNTNYTINVTLEDFLGELIIHDLPPGMFDYMLGMKRDIIMSHNTKPQQKVDCGIGFPYVGYASLYNQLIQIYKYYSVGGDSESAKNHSDEFGFNQKSVLDAACDEHYGDDEDGEKPPVYVMPVIAPVFQKHKITGISYYKINKDQTAIALNKYQYMAMDELCKVVQKVHNDRQYN